MKSPAIDNTPKPILTKKNSQTELTGTDPVQSKKQIQFDDTVEDPPKKEVYRRHRIHRDINDITHDTLSGTLTPGSSHPAVMKEKVQKKKQRKIADEKLANSKATHKINQLVTEKAGNKKHSGLTAVIETERNGEEIRDQSYEFHEKNEPTTHAKYRLTTIEELRGVVKVEYDEKPALKKIEETLRFLVNRDDEIFQKLKDGDEELVNEIKSELMQYPELKGGEHVLDEQLKPENAQRWKDKIIGVVQPVSPRTALGQPIV